MGWESGERDVSLGGFIDAVSTPTDFTIHGFVLASPQKWAEGGSEYRQPFSFVSGASASFAAMPAPNSGSRAFSVSVGSASLTGVTESLGGGFTRYYISAVAHVIYPDYYVPFWTSAGGSRTGDLTPGHLFQLTVTVGAGSMNGGTLGAGVDTNVFGGTGTATATNALSGFVYNGVNSTTGTAEITDCAWYAVSDEGVSFPATPEFLEGTSAQVPEGWQSSFTAALPPTEQNYSFHAVCWDDNGKKYTGANYFVNIPPQRIGGAVSKNGDVILVTESGHAATYDFNASGLASSLTATVRKRVGVTDEVVNSATVATSWLGAFWDNRQNVWAHFSAFGLHTSTDLGNSFSYAAMNPYGSTNDERIMGSSFAEIASVSGLCFAYCATYYREDDRIVLRFRRGSSGVSGYWKNAVNVATITPTTHTAALYSDGTSKMLLSPFWLIVERGQSQLIITDGLTAAYVSNDFGATWQSESFSAPFGSASYKLASVAALPLGGFGAVWVECGTAPNTIYFSRSMSRFTDWTAPVIVDTFTPSSVPRAAPLLLSFERAGTSKLGLCVGDSLYYESNNFGGTWEAVTIG